MGSDQELNQEENKLPFSSWLFLLWKDLDATIKGNNTNTGCLPKGKMIPKKVRSEKITFSANLLLTYLCWRKKVSAEDSTFLGANSAIIIDFK